MFKIFRRAKQARQVAYSIAQLINMLSVALESNGPKAPERILRKLATKCREETIGETRSVCALVPMTDTEALVVYLSIQSEGLQSIIIEGGEKFAGFMLTCQLPPKAVVIDLQPGARYKITPEARALYIECKKLPNATTLPL